MDKLHKVLRVRQQREQEQAQIMARSQAATQAAAEKRAELETLMEDYRRQHAELAGNHAEKFRQFERFFTELAKAVQAQQQVLTKLEQVEARDTEAFLTCYRERLALERMLEQRELAHKSERIKKARRSHIHRAPDAMV